MPAYAWLQIYEKKCVGSIAFTQAYTHVNTPASPSAEPYPKGTLSILNPKVLAPTWVAVGCMPSVPTEHVELGGRRDHQTPLVDLELGVVSLARCAPCGPRTPQGASSHGATCRLMAGCRIALSWAEAEGPM